MLRDMDQIAPNKTPVIDLEEPRAAIPSRDEITVADICDRLGRKVIAERVGVGVTAVSNASVEGKFASAWFLAIKGMCDDIGIPCPERLFKFKMARPDGAAPTDMGAD